VTKPASSWLWEQPEAPKTTGPSRSRRMGGWLCCALALIVAAAFTVGTWNPWRYVYLQRYLGNPFAGAIAFFLLTLVATWLLLPVRSEAVHGGRQTLRWGMVAPVVVALIAYGLLGGRFVFSSRVVAHSPSGHRSLALVTGQGDRDAELHVWAGAGLHTRDLGGMGRPCGINVTASFTDENTVHVSTVYGDHDLRLDPATGHPVDILSRNCTA
jgi:hypothetical protein